MTITTDRPERPEPTAPLPRPQAKRRTTASERRERRTALLFISPAFVYFLLFWALPIGATAFYSFTDWRLGQDPVGAGVDNYTGLASDPLFHDSLRASLVITIGSVTVSLLLALGVATLLSHPGLRLGWMWRMIVILPVVTDWVATGLVFQLIFLPNQGVLAGMATSAGVDSLVNVPWVSDSTLAPIAIVIFIVWKQTGLYAIFFLAGLKSTPNDVLEAARLDGANSWQTFWRIRWPMMRPITLFVIVISFILTLGLFEPIFMLTGGGPAGETRTLPIFLYENFFTFGNSGYASAAGVVFLALSLSFAFVASRRLKESYEA